MMPVFYATGNELLLSVGRFSSLIRLESRNMKILDVFLFYIAQILHILDDEFFSTMQFL